MQYIRDNYGEDPADYNKVTDLMILFIWWLMIWWSLILNSFARWLALIGIILTFSLKSENTGVLSFISTTCI